MKEKILVSACLTGINCKYNGGNNLVKNLVEDLKDYEIILICPEVDGGLLTPRVPSEVLNDKIINKDGIDNTSYFTKGAIHALNIAEKYNIKKAILKSKSPSCGYKEIYDGTFTNKIVSGNGFTANLLSEQGIKIYNEFNYKDLIKGE